MSLQRIWKTTANANGPSGRKYKGTFRDVSLANLTPEYIDNFDYICIKCSVKRSDLVEVLEKFGTYDLQPLRHYQSLFENP